MDIILNRVETAIKTHDSKLMRMLALDIESELLEKTTFPEWCLDLFIRLFNDEKFCSVPGSEHFVWVLYNDFEKLSVSQAELFFKIFTTDYDRFKNIKLLHSVADFIARKYPVFLSLNAFQDALNQGSEASRYAALVGSEILTMNKKTTEKEKYIAANLISQIRS